MADTKKITSLDALIKKGAGLKATRENTADTVCISTGDTVLEIKNLTEDEVLAYITELTELSKDDNAGLAEELKKFKEELYPRCAALQEYAKAVTNEGRTEPWDVFEELFTLGERNRLRQSFYRAVGIADVLTSEAELKNE